MKDVAEAIETLLKRPRLKSGLKKWITSSLWNEVVGQEIAGRTRVVSFYRGRMVVIVPSGPWAHELTVNRDTITENINKAAVKAGGEKVLELAFKVGSVKKQPSSLPSSIPEMKKHANELFFVSSWDDDFMATLEDKADHDPMARRVLKILLQERKRLKVVQQAGGSKCPVCGIWHTGKGTTCLPCSMHGRLCINGGVE